MRKYIFKFKSLFIITTFLVIIFSFLNIALAFMFKYIIDLSTDKNLNNFIFAAILFLLFCLLEFIIDVLLPIVKALYIKKTMIYMRKDIFSHILNKSIKSFNEENSSKYISILNTDLNMIEQDGICNIFNLIKHFTSFILAVISIIYISIPITIAVFIMSSITFIIPQFFLKSFQLEEKNIQTHQKYLLLKLMIYCQDLN